MAQFFSRQPRAHCWVRYSATLPMCPPLSCCHRRGTSLLSTHFYYLGRLLLASGTEELPAKHLSLPARMDTLWDYVHNAVQNRYQVSTARALDLTEFMLAALLREECCCQSLRQAISLAEALGSQEGVVSSLQHYVEK